MVCITPKPKYAKVGFKLCKEMKGKGCSTWLVLSHGTLTSFKPQITCPVDVVCAGGKKLHPCLSDFDVSNTNTNHSISSSLYHLDLDLDLDLFIFGNRIYRYPNRPVLVGLAVTAS